jgi:hypothetical protein
VGFGQARHKKDGRESDRLTQARAPGGGTGADRGRRRLPALKLLDEDKTNMASLQATLGEIGQVQRR